MCRARKRCAQVVADGGGLRSSAGSIPEMAAGPRAVIRRPARIRRRILRAVLQARRPGVSRPGGLSGLFRCPERRPAPGIPWGSAVVNQSVRRRMILSGLATHWSGNRRVRRSQPAAVKHLMFSPSEIIGPTLTCCRWKRPDIVLLLSVSFSYVFLK